MCDYMVFGVTPDGESVVLKEDAKKDKMVGRHISGF